MKNNLFKHQWIKKQRNSILFLWDFSKKEESNSIIKQWHITFQTLDLKGKQFLDLLNDNLTDIELSYTKMGL